jgi:general secretion pathway protein E
MLSLQDILIERGLVTKEHLAAARIAEQDRGADLGATLLRLGVITEDTLISATSELLSLPILAPADTPTAEEVREAALEVGFLTSWCIENLIIVWRRDGVLSAAGPRILSPWIQEAMECWPQMPENIFLAATPSVEPVLLALRGLEGFYSQASDSARLMELADDAPVVRFVDTILADALSAGASDIHFEPFEDRVIVRYRVDGVLSQRRVAPRDVFNAVSSRIKLLSSMDIAERRLPQDGRQTVRLAGREIDLRVSSLPTTWGESIVIRLLGKTHAIPQLLDLGLNADQADSLSAATSKPNGLVLLTGPTGSGKTTTVYRLVSRLNDGKRKIVTIEDPVELDLPGVLQMTVRPDIALDFAAGLRSVLRQDPDVIFVGEIRDSETATTAVQAALTGHLVISTLHTNSAMGAVPRLLDLGVEHFLLADVLRATIGQRLVRRVCESCAGPDRDPALETEAQARLPDFTMTETPNWRSGAGCALCAGAGFRGRIGVFEVATVDPSIQHAIRMRAPMSELAALARDSRITSLLENGIVKARAGVTTLTEVLRVLDGDLP